MTPLKLFTSLAVLSACTFSSRLAQGAETSAEDIKALEIYRTIIEMRTAAGHGNVPKMAAYLASELKAAGFTDDDIQILPSGDTASLIVQYKGDGSSSDHPILFIGHMDVVDANPEDWELDPFTLTEKDGYFFGRGTIDNKYGIMNLTQTFMRLKQEGFIPTRDLILAFSGDEETGMSTTKMLAYNRPELANAEYALNSDAGGGSLAADGTAMTYGIQAAEKTYATFEITARNEGGHSSRPKRNDNAIYDLADALKAIQAYQFPVQYNDITLATFAGLGQVIGGDLGEAMVTFAETPDDTDAAARIAQEPSYVGSTRTTCVATMLSAGHAENALPQSATATVNCRIFPGTTVDSVRDVLKTTVNNDALEFVTLGDPVESPISELRDDVTRALSKAVHARYPGLPLGAYMESGGTDGMHFRSAGIPTLAISANFMNESDMYAHGLNERMPVSSFYGGLDHWMIIMKELAGPE
ncbi:peptidase M20 [Algimonas arctica]|uniref:Peptidase M20 n=1 Tax=Algimonas arctica TaxID=1479486 RepID=A0A8J3CLM7_9PROT|nr:M20/M25/M40 family metallo-hydrolase [Algimonas arctica]GHA84530.1 peptidase M20 [Algimonas arctica]